MPLLYSFILIIAVFFTVLPTERAEALSCLPVADYLEQVVGGDEFVFIGSMNGGSDTTGYFTEHVTVTKALQGYVPEQMMLYHRTDDTWGYFCNQGPGEKGEAGLYVVGFDEYGKYVVHQRLALTDPLVKTLENDLKEAEVTGGISEHSAKDLRNQIADKIRTLFAEILLLMSEYRYWEGR